MTTPAFKRAVEAALKVAPGEIPDAGAPLIVRAVLLAIREPDEGMRSAMRVGYGEGAGSGYHGALDAYTRAVDHLLSEG